MCKKVAARDPHGLWRKIGGGAHQTQASDVIGYFQGKVWHIIAKKSIICIDR